MSSTRRNWTAFVGAMLLAAALPASAAEPADLLWATATQGASTADVGWFKVAAFPDGSCVRASSLLRGTTVFGAGQPNETAVAVGNQMSGVVVRHNADGSFAWVRAMSGTAAPGFGYLVRTLGVAAYPDGSCVATGSFGSNGTVTFGAGTPNQVTFGGSGCFVARYAADGTFLWARRSDFSASARAVAALPDGSCVVVGEFNGTRTFGAGEPGATTLVSAGQSDLFVARFTSTGSLAWARRAGGTTTDRALAVSALADGSVVVAGGFGGFSGTASATFGPGEPGATTLVSAGGLDGFVARYGAGGSLTWARRIGSAGFDECYGVAAFADGAVVVAGQFSGTAVVGQGEPNATTLVASGDADAIVARYASTGALAWARRAGSSVPAGSGEGAFDVAACPDGVAFVVGRFSGSVTFGAGEPGATTLVSAGQTEAFVARYALDGKVAAARRAGGAFHDAAGAVSATPTGAAVVYGFADGSAPGGAVFGAGEPGQKTITSVSAFPFLAMYAGATEQASIVAPDPIVAECDDGAEGATVHFAFDVVAGSADRLVVADTTAGRVLLEVADPTTGAYGVGPATFPHGASTVEIVLWRGTEVLASATFTVSVEDTVAPTLHGVGPRTVELLGPTTDLHASLLGITATDACDPAPSLELAPAAVPLGTTTVVATARDRTGNVSSESFEVTVVDTVPPAFLVVPDDVERGCEEGGVLVAFDVLAEDASGTVSVACVDPTGRVVDPAGTRFELGSHVVTCTASDASGNETSVEFTVLVFDDEAPVVVCPGDVVVPTDPGAAWAVVEFDVSVTDACDPVAEVVCVAPWGPVRSGDTFPVGETPVVCSARDHAGNTATCSFRVVVQDREPPTIVGPSFVALTTDCAGSPLAIDAATLGASATDNVDATVGVVCTPSSVLPGATTVLLRAADDDGNVAYRSVTVSVLKGAFDVRFLRPLDGRVDNAFTLGQVVPVKVSVSCDGVFEPGATVDVAEVVLLDAAGSPVVNLGVASVGPDAGDDGTSMRLVDGAYVFNLSTKGWSGARGTRFRVTVRVVKEGHVGMVGHVVLLAR
ncbi:MAG: HYR domain-containing protein [Planctomycetes bacterium]|nr:HYR domain-containing protein [Planctomycetota bacterium]